VEKYVEKYGKLEILKRLTALLVWTALLLQFYVSGEHAFAQGHSVVAALSKLFSYFTILTNLLVAFVVSSAILDPRREVGFFRSSSVQVATAVYIVIVGVIYNLLLRKLWHPQGLHLVADQLLHIFVPIFYVAFCFSQETRSRLAFRAAADWLIFPLAYFGFSLIRGTFVGVYPYYFVDPKKLGYGTVFLIAGIMLTGFYLLGLGAIALSHKTRNKKGLPE
jgi:hypothetical protein